MTPVPVPLTERVAWSIRETAAMLGVSTRTISRLIADGKVETIGAGAGLRVTRRSVEALGERREAS